MADEVDIANDVAEAMRERAIADALVKPHVTPGIGFCINCAVLVEDDRRWCSAECRDDWLKYGRK